MKETMRPTKQTTNVPMALYHMYEILYTLFKSSLQHIKSESSIILMIRPRPSEGQCKQREKWCCMKLQTSYKGENVPSKAYLLGELYGASVEVGSKCWNCQKWGCASVLQEWGSPEEVHSWKIENQPRFGDVAKGSRQPF